MELNENLLKQTKINVSFWKDGTPYYCILVRDQTGWLFGFAYTNPAGALIYRGDGILEKGWPSCLGRAIEWAKKEFGFTDVTVTDVRTEEYLGEQ
jgi:hypothetical protein